MQTVQATLLARIEALEKNQALEKNPTNLPPATPTCTCTPQRLTPRTPTARVLTSQPAPITTQSSTPQEPQLTSPSPIPQVPTLEVPCVPVQTPVSIDKTVLIDHQEVLRKYPKLRGECKIRSLSSKLAKEAFFGEQVMMQCTVKGHRDYPALPQQELAELKQVLFSQFPQFWSSPTEFEPIWSTCIDSINQACKHLRRKNGRF